MHPLQFLFSGYSIIGLTLAILGVTMALYLLRLPHKTWATRTFVAFFILVALSGLATIFTNALVYWGDLFRPWQDAFILAAGVALTYFAYRLPPLEQSRVARAALLVMSFLAFAAFVYSFIFDVRFLAQWTPDLEVNDVYYLLLPVGIVLVMLFFLWRSLQLSAFAGKHQRLREPGGVGQRLFHPRGEEAQLLRNLAVALSFALLPGLLTLIELPGGSANVLSNIGALAAIIAIALVYLNYAPEIESFVAKLVGITLSTVLLIITIFATIDVYFLSPGLSEVQTSSLVANWLLLILVASATVLLIFPRFFRRALVRPLEDLLRAIRQVNEGDLDAAAPVQFNDEIGSLARSFNQLTHSLKLSRQQQADLFDQLQASYEKLEQRVSERTQQLAAFTDLTMLSGSYDNLADILQPALNRIMDIGLCDALCVHLLDGESRALTMLAQRSLAPAVVGDLHTVPLTPRFVQRMRQTDSPVLVEAQSKGGPLPPQLKVASYTHYVGSPLVAGEVVHGWLSCYRGDGAGFELGEISLVVALARQLGVITENYHLHQQISAVATYEERQRLARNLHDAVTQLVYSMTLFTRSSQQALEDEDWLRLQDNLTHLSTTSLQALRELRFLLFELQPPAFEEEGLVKALQSRLEMVERRAGMRVECHLDESLVTSPDVAGELYYVATEALNNTLKHAAADRVSLVLAQENGCLRLSASDNGAGFDVEQTEMGYGIHNMKQRIEKLGGALQIESVLGEGTRVVALIPVSAS